MKPLKKKLLSPRKDKTSPKVKPLSSNPIFGIPLAEAAKKSDPIHGAVPAPLHKAITWLNTYGLKEEGLYRIPGSKAVFDIYKESFDNGEDVDFTHEKSPENLAMIVVKYLQELPEPVYSSQFEQHFKIAFSIENADERAGVLRAILLKIPYVNRETIKVLADHLRLVALHSDENLMTPKNIGVSLSLSVGTVTGTLFHILVSMKEEAPSTIVFKVPIETAVKNSYRFDTVGELYVPNVVEETIEWLTRHESYKSDLFIEKGDHARVMEYKRLFNSGQIETLPEDAHVHDVASLLHLWLSELPEELIPKPSLSEFKRLYEEPKKDHRMTILTILAKMSDICLRTLKIIIEFFSKIISNSYLIDASLLGSLISIAHKNSYAIIIRHAARGIFDQVDDYRIILAFEEKRAMEERRIAEEKRQARHASKERKHRSAERKNRLSDKARPRTDEEKRNSDKKNGERRKSDKRRSERKNGKASSPKPKEKDIPEGDDEKLEEEGTDKLRKNKEEDKKMRRNKEREEEKKNYKEEKLQSPEKVSEERIDKKKKKRSEEKAMKKKKGSEEKIMKKKSSDEKVLKEKISKDKVVKSSLDDRIFKKTSVEVLTESSEDRTSEDLKVKRVEKKVSSEKVERKKIGEKRKKKKEERKNNDDKKNQINDDKEDQNNDDENKHNDDEENKHNDDKNNSFIDDDNNKHITASDEIKSEKIRRNDDKRLKSSDDMKHKPEGKVNDDKTLSISKSKSSDSSCKPSRKKVKNLGEDDLKVS